MESSKAVERVQLGRATVRDFMAVVMSGKTQDASVFFDFCEKVVEGGIMNLPMDELPAVRGEVAAEIQRHSEAIRKAVSIAHMLRDIDKHLEMGGGDDGTG